MCRFLVTLLISLCLARGLFGQASNLDVFSELTVACLGHVPNDLNAFELESAGEMEFLRPALTSHWLSEGKRVFVVDSVAVTERSLHRLRYRPESADVTFDRAGRGELLRSVMLTVRYSLVDPEGLLLDEGRCRRVHEDRVPRAELARLQAAPFPQAVGEVPDDRTWRSWAEPLVLGGSIAAVVYLFFSVRS